METEALLGLLVGSLGAGFAVLVVVGMPLGWFNRLLVVRPKQGVPPAAKERLLRAILALNDERRPWLYRETPADERADLVAEWKLADARWWGAFSANHFRHAYRASIALDESRRELRIFEETSTVSWTAGATGSVPHVGWEGSFFRGVMLFQRTRVVAYGVKDVLPLRVGELYNYDFDPWRVKSPLLKLAIENGWSYCPVVLRRHLGRKQANERLPVAQ